MTSQQHDVKDLSLSAQEVSRIEWAFREMPVVRGLLQRFEQERPLQDVRVSGCLHITTEPANLARVLQAGGAELVLYASNPLSTQDDGADLVSEMHKRRTDLLEEMLGGTEESTTGVIRLRAMTEAGALRSRS